MKKPGLSLAVLLLALSSPLSATTVSPVNPPSLLLNGIDSSFTESRLFSLKTGYVSRVTKTSWSNTVVASEDSSIPVPAAVWLFLSGLIGIIGVSRRRRK